ncbi:hypothetical protein M430DRAFT_219615 [Amorphotheca resinae ATCC 22711]|uniref:Secreted protein n=1 Tax=Amorphotheca resinae ATCC 22711 TaxID=857342 RepID=A0A2T3B5F2_AMORE|nr:hypothetical protein M430DRAFT_219615 [Amorphotheca resinae ATCC 22711]PSS21981.1 hypothetical protein M430DRAFT_219615 [Amorphotheca resinae ATCC 22711]
MGLFFVGLLWIFFFSVTLQSWTLQGHDATAHGKVLSVLKRHAPRIHGPRPSSVHAPWKNNAMCSLCAEIPLPPRHPLPSRTSSSCRVLSPVPRYSPSVSKESSEKS